MGVKVSEFSNVSLGQIMKGLCDREKSKLSSTVSGPWYGSFLFYSNCDKKTLIKVKYN